MTGIPVLLKKRLFIFLLLLISSSNAFSDPKWCTLNGQWINMQNLGPVYKLKQMGSQVMIDELVGDSDCGSYLVDGVSDGHKFIFKFYSSDSDKEYCRTWSQLVGEFTSPDCTRIQGEMTIHEEINNKPYETKMPFTWYRQFIEILDPFPGMEHYITAEPKMPLLQVQTILKMPIFNNIKLIDAINYNTPPYTWSADIKHQLTEKRLLQDKLPTVTAYESYHKVDFNSLGGMRGGTLTLSVDYYNASKDEKKYIIKGTNPGKWAIEQVLTEPVLRHIACQESKYRQFEADREEGKGFPVVGKNKEGKKIGGVGIMQLYKPKATPNQIWNWRENIEAALELFKEKRAMALALPKLEVKRLNKERLTINLPRCKSLPPLNQEQLQREILRLYNGGDEYRWEPRDDPNCQGHWVVKTTFKSGSDADYVDHVMSCKL